MRLSVAYRRCRLPTYRPYHKLKKPALSGLNQNQNLKYQDYLAFS
jgi:hypothetical protein